MLPTTTDETRFQQPVDEVLTPDEAGNLLKMTRRQVYGLTRGSARARMPIPIPMMRVNGNLRFRRSALAQWLKDLEEYERTGQLPASRN